MLPLIPHPPGHLFHGYMGILCIGNRVPLLSDWMVEEEWLSRQRWEWKEKHGESDKADWLETLPTKLMEERREVDRELGFLYNFNCHNHHHQYLLKTSKPWHSHYYPKPIAGYETWEGRRKHVGCCKPSWEYLSDLFATDYYDGDKGSLEKYI